MIKINVILLGVLTLFLHQKTKACDLFSTLCLEAIQTNEKRIVVGTITNSFTNSIELTIIDVLYGVENNSTIIIWDAATFECNGPWPNNANDMGAIGDTILCMVQPITAILNPWDEIGDYRRINTIGGFATYTNFSVGQTFDGIFGFDEVLSLDFANYCCDQLDQILNLSIGGLPNSTGSSSPISISAFPSGGTFSGPGIVLNAFNPAIAGPGNHTITYTIDDEFGCSFSAQQDILVFTIIFNFVNYNLGTINPKIANQIEVEVEVPEPDFYTFQVFDMRGMQRFQKSIQLDIGIHLQEIQFNQKLPEGLYLFKISNSHTYVSKKFTIFDK